jgi:cytochrome c oxidase cbb3-type subunit III
MRVKSRLMAAVFSASLASLAYLGWAQAPAENQETPQRPPGGFVPGQVRAADDPAVVEHGKTLYAINCQGCHGRDLRGGDMGGPNLLRSEVALADQHGEGIVPIIQGARQAMGMPKIGLSIEDSNAVAAYVRSVVAMIGVQGKPPEQQAPLDIVVGNAAAGQAYFDAKCKSCHSPEGDLRGIATRISNPKTLQNSWITGRMRGEAPDPGTIATVTVTPASGPAVQGQLVHIDEFIVVLKLPDDTSLSFQRHGDEPKVVVQDPLQAHKDLLPAYTDADIHNVTAYLVTLK